MDEEPQRFGHHQNAFGALRLLFASLVIVSHVPEIVDGDARRELLRSLGGATTFGQFAVSGFFLISGYLITASYLSSTTNWNYLKKRIARIYPAFIVAWLICMAVVAPLAGGAPIKSIAELAKRLIDCAALQPPFAPGAFRGTHDAALNGSMWTISFEFRCYLLVVVLGVSTILRRRALIVGLAALMLAAVPFIPVPLDKTPIWQVAYLVGDLRGVRLTGLFLAGSAFYLYRDTVRYTRLGVGLAAIGMIAGLGSARFEPLAWGACGGYLVMAIAHRFGGNALNKINNKNDISYGVYLYAWPATKLILSWEPNISITILGILTFVVAYACGWASWIFVERPILLRVRSGGAAARTSAVAAG